MTANQRVIYSAMEAIQQLGYFATTLEQLQIVSGIISGRDVFVILQTGTGKSLCYACLPTALYLVLPIKEPSVVLSLNQPFNAVSITLPCKPSHMFAATGYA